jgi:hypothetical protein
MDQLPTLLFGISIASLACAAFSYAWATAD